MLTGRRAEKVEIAVAAVSVPVGVHLEDAVANSPNDGREDTLLLSAGDLDEAVVTAIARSDLATDTNVLGSAFEKIDAFRKGVLGGLNVCA